MRRHTHIRFRQLAVVILVWIIYGVMITIYDHLLLQTQISLGASEVYSFGELLLRNAGAGLIGALTGGSFMIFFVNAKYADKPYGYTVAAVLLSFVVVVTMVTIIIGLIVVPYQTRLPLSDPIAQYALIEFLTDEYPLKSFLAWLFVVAITQVSLQINSKFGYGVFWNILRGKYHTPVTETRVFMFLDLNQSTAIAERLGNKSYHALLKDFFRDITNPILDCKGSIYQYVGDEVIISWNMRNGFDDANSIKCFFSLKEYIHSQREKYLFTYGMIPTFKAGLHCGEVVAGEVGIVKRDITYSGDVLNTTARIQSMCREFQVDFIASHHLATLIPDQEIFEISALGSIKLRGKETELQLVSIRTKL
jgi:adenylate cyclase